MNSPEKKMLVFAVIIFLAVNAGATKLAKNEINVSIDKQGYTTITENYFILFEYAGDENRFQELLQKNSSSLSSWRADYSFLYPKFESSQLIIDPSTVSIQWDEKNNSFVLNYSLKKPLPRLIKEQPRSEEWEIPDYAFINFLNSGLIEIPENNSIVFSLPSNALVDIQKINPLAIIQGNKITLTGMRANSLGLVYSVQKQIVPTVGTDFLEKILSDPATILSIMIALVLVMGLAYWKRKSIESRIENFIVNNSEIHGKEAEELEIEFE
ncbi:MAG: hypothetical protein ABIA76_03640 [Candidatus Diapherotrites archaeon]